MKIGNCKERRREREIEQGFFFNPKCLIFFSMILIFQKVFVFIFIFISSGNFQKQKQKQTMWNTLVKHIEKKRETNYQMNGCYFFLMILVFRETFSLCPGKNQRNFIVIKKKISFLIKIIEWCFFIEFQKMFPINIIFGCWNQSRYITLRKKNISERRKREEIFSMESFYSCFLPNIK